MNKGCRIYDHYEPAPVINAVFIDIKEHIAVYVQAYGNSDSKERDHGDQHIYAKTFNLVPYSVI